MMDRRVMNLDVLTKDFLNQMVDYYYYYFHHVAMQLLVQSHYFHLYYRVHQWIQTKWDSVFLQHQMIDVLMLSLHFVVYYLFYYFGQVQVVMHRWVQMNDVELTKNVKGRMMLLWMFVVLVMHQLGSYMLCVIVQRDLRERGREK